MNLSRRLAVFAAGVCLVLPVRGADDGSPPAGWEEVQRSGGVIIYGRYRAGSSVRELRGVGTIDAPNWVVKNVIDDGDHYTEFMPNTLESRVLARDPGQHTATAYAKISAPLISPRDYTLTIHDESKVEADGGVVYRSRWEPSSKGPVEKPGVTRIKLIEGSWTLEPMDNGQKTRAVYQLYSDGGGIPTMLLNQVSKRRIGEVYEAIGKRAELPQYRKAKPAYP